MNHIPANDAVLYQDNNYLIKFRYQVEAKGIVYTFSYFNWGALREEGFSETYWLNAGFSVISIQSAVNDWFSGLPLAALGTIADSMAAQFTQRIGYGGSMGGFAALALRDFLSMTHVIAIAPQYSVTEEFDQRWASYMTGKHLLTISHSPTRPRCLLIYDPCSLDKLHAQRISNVVNNCVELRLPHVGHHPGVVLNEIGLLDQIQKSFIGDMPVDNYYSLFKRDRKQSRTFLIALARKMAARRWRYAVHARLLLKSMEPLAADEKVLLRQIEHRFRDPGNIRDASGTETPVKSDGFASLGHMAQIVGKSIPASAALTPMRLAHQSSSNTFILNEGFASHPYVRIDAIATDAGRYVIDFELPSSDVRFFSLVFSKNDAGFSGNTSHLDVFNNMAFNSSEDCFVTFSGSLEWPKRFSVYFNVSARAELRLMLSPLAQLAGIRPGMVGAPEFSIAVRSSLPVA